MSEKLSEPKRVARPENLLRFQGSRNIPSMKKHEEEGITPTNNLYSKYFLDEDPKTNDIARMVAEKDEDLWLAGHESAIVYRAECLERIDRAMSGVTETEQQADAREAAYWAMAVNMHDAYEIVADTVPDPLKLCL
jgi:hypothetical protein